MVVFLSLAMQAHGGAKCLPHLVGINIRRRPMVPALLGGEEDLDMWALLNLIGEGELLLYVSKTGVTLVHAHGKHGLKAIYRKGFSQ